MNAYVRLLLCEYGDDHSIALKSLAMEFSREPCHRLKEGLFFPMLLTPPWVLNAN